MSWWGRTPTRMPLFLTLETMTVLMANSAGGYRHAGQVERSCWPSPHVFKVAHWLLILQGQDCFGAFMAWGLPKEVLREIWALVAGSQGQLDKHQFVSALYLMDSVKKVRWVLNMQHRRPSIAHEPTSCL